MYHRNTADGNMAQLILALEETASQRRDMLCTGNEHGILRANGLAKEIGFNFITRETRKYGETVKRDTDL
jgi:hypothetical protein